MTRAKGGTSIKATKKAATKKYMIVIDSEYVYNCQTHSSIAEAQKYFEEESGNDTYGNVEIVEVVAVAKIKRVDWHIQ